ncbi:MAG: PorV/PorQ family protein, partial [Candidatus Marinimicrobia bacterium]|nr:PorV/PorQ family protein [Candidatus Neomarinimicrobiota bacterium]
IEEWVAGIAYARSVTDRFSFGGHLRYAVQDLGSTLIWRAVEDTTVTVENRLSPVVLDFGTIYYTGFKDLRLSMSFRNFSQEVIYVRDKFELPISMRIGVAMNVFKMSNQSLMVAIDAVHPRDYTERIHLGAEYLFHGLALRAGYKFNYDEEDFSAGFGINKNIGGSVLKIDYAFTSFGIFNAVQRFSIGFSF